MFKLLFLPVKLLIGFVKLSGLRGVLLLGIGVAIGLLVAPTSGDRLRAKLSARIQAIQDGRAAAPVGTVGAGTGSV